ncbi:methyltransferase [Shewanella sp. SE1]|nr:methyltransferase [Shewanella sp. SE1]
MCDCQQNSSRQAEPVAYRVETRLTAVDCSLPEVKAELQQLSQLLLSSRELWSVRSFEHHKLPWQQRFAKLAAALWAIDDDALETVDASQSLLLATLWPALAAGLSEQELALWDKRHFAWQLFDYPAPEKDNGQPKLCAATEARLSAGIKGRKWQQISRFANTIATHNNPFPLLEWCAGKGHLGRLLSALSGKAVLSLEWQASLCEAGELAAKKRNLPQQFVCADAFAAEPCYLKPKQHAIALHACGELHLTLLRRAVASGTAVVSVSPCCYHLLPSGDITPLSLGAQEQALRLDKAALQLPLNHSVIANQKARADRIKEVSWRLGFDSLQREVRTRDTYLPLPAVRQSQLSGSFKEFCLWAAAQKGVLLPEAVDFAAYQHLGEQRRRLTARIDLAAHLFRPVIERYLLLDRVCFLLEAGYRVQLGAFCEQATTPRNALIHAWLPGGR